MRRGRRFATGTTHTGSRRSKSIPANPAELLTSPRFQEVVQDLREQFDFVLIDTPPLLAVTDPAVVTPRVDGVLLALRIVRNGRPDAVLRGT